MNTHLPNITGSLTGKEFLFGVCLMFVSFLNIFLLCWCFGPGTGEGTPSVQTPHLLMGVSVPVVSRILAMSASNDYLIGKAKRKQSLLITLC